MWLRVPALYDAALEHPVVHTLEHLTFGAARLVLVAPAVADPSRLRLGGMDRRRYGVDEDPRRLPRHRARVRAGLIYDAYDQPGKRWGMTALDDQHVAGLIMALEQSIVMGIALAWLFARMLAESEEEERRRERWGSDPLGCAQRLGAMSVRAT